MTQKSKPLNIALLPVSTLIQGVFIPIILYINYGPGQKSDFGEHCLMFNLYVGVFLGWQKKQLKSK